MTAQDRQLLYLLRAALIQALCAIDKLLGLPPTVQTKRARAADPLTD
jgi:hypothetical protein